MCVQCILCTVLHYNLHTLVKIVYIMAVLSSNNGRNCHVSIVYLVEHTKQYGMNE